MLIIDECNEEMFKGRILVPPAAGFSKRIMEGLFEFASKTRHLGCNSRTRGKPTGFDFECHMTERGNQEPVPVFSTDYRFASCLAAERPLKFMIF
jgi:hypothetical protein